LPKLPIQIIQDYIPNIDPNPEYNCAKGPKHLYCST